MELLEKYHLDAVLVSDGYNMRYLSGFSGAAGYLYISSARKVILTDFRYTLQAQTESKGFEVLEVGKEGYVTVLNRLLEEDGAYNLGFEDENLLVCDYERFRKALKAEEWVPLRDEITKLRVIKKPEEIAFIKQAEAIGDMAFSKILEILKPGMAELEVAAELEYIMKKNGAEKLSFDTIAASGVNSAMPHAVPTAKKLENGDFLTMDFGCIYQGYCSDMTRTVVIGKAGQNQKKLYHTVLKAQQAALDFIHGGQQGKAVDAVARKIIEDAGYQNCFGHGLGHSVGLYIHENPRFSPSEEGVVLPGTIETVEPGIYIAGFGGVRIEDLVLVTETGCENFTHSPKQLIEL